MRGKLIQVLPYLATISLFTLAWYTVKNSIQQILPLYIMLCNPLLRSRAFVIKEFWNRVAQFGNGKATLYQLSLGAWHHTVGCGLRISGDQEFDIPILYPALGLNVRFWGVWSTIIVANYYIIPCYSTQTMMPKKYIVYFIREGRAMIWRITGHGIANTCTWSCQSSHSLYTALAPILRPNIDHFKP